MSIKRALKRTAVVLMKPVSPGQFSSRVVVLCYHSVHPSIPFTSATPELFERNLQWLRENCDVIRFSDVTQTRPRPARAAVAITFDDGYADNYEHAFPLLQRYGLPATFFVTAGFVERDPRVMDRFQRLRSCPSGHIRPLTWAQIREMADAGMEIGAHTYSHPNLAALNGAACRAELIASKDILEQRIGRVVSTMAYPFGKPGRHFNRETLAHAAESGYSYAAAVLFRALRTNDSPLAIPRITVGMDDISTLREKVSGQWDIVGTWQERAPLWAARIVSPIDFHAVPGNEIAVPCARDSSLPEREARFQAEQR